MKRYGMVSSVPPHIRAGQQTVRAKFELNSGRDGWKKRCEI